MSWPAGRRPRRKASTGWIDLSVPYSRDPLAQYFVQEHPHGATLEQVAIAVGLTRERVRQIERSALIRLDRACRTFGLSRELVLGLHSRADGFELVHWEELAS